MTAEEKKAWQQRVSELGRDWIAAAESGVAPDSAEAQELAQRHVEWLTGIPGTPGGGAPGGDMKGYVIGLGEMYVADPRFGANYGERRRQGRRGVRPRRAARLRGGEPVEALASMASAT